MPDNLRPNPNFKQQRSRTSTLNFASPLAPVMSRENSLEDIPALQDDEGPSGSGPGPSSSTTHLSRSLGMEESHVQPDSSSASASASGSGLAAPFAGTGTYGRKASKSISSQSRPPLSAASKRAQSYYNYPTPSPSSRASPSPKLLPLDAPQRIGLKRRTSTPSLAKQALDEHVDEDTAHLSPQPALLDPAGSGSGSGHTLNYKGKDKSKDVVSRARSTSTSIVVPQTLSPTSPTLPVAPYEETHSRHPGPMHLHVPPHQPWRSDVHVIPESPVADFHHTPTTSHAHSHSHAHSYAHPSTSLLGKAYDLGESSVLRLVQWARPQRTNLHRRGSETDSEKGLSEEDNGDDIPDTIESVTTTRTSLDTDYTSSAHTGKPRWELSEDEEPGAGMGAGGYFSLPPTPPNYRNDTGIELTVNGEVLDAHRAFGKASLPTPALSSRSLSNGRALGSRTGRRTRRTTDGTSTTSWNLDLKMGWLTNLLNVGSGTKTGEVVRELGWTVGVLVGLFCITLGMVFLMLKGLPITQLKQIPRSTTDLQLLSAEIRAYMASSDWGWWHTIGVLTFVGCWKHAWSVPGAVVLNILVGSLLEPMPALFLLTLITATGSLGSYMLSRPLAPLIAVLFPKPLSLVQVALAPESVPSFSHSHTAHPDRITPIQISDDPSTPPLGSGSQSVWRRLFIMRAMGIVPWSGMNVACGVVGVNWKTFWLTTAAGSASWSYTTASIGNILSKLALPTNASVDGGGIGVGVTGTGSGAGAQGESLTALLRDPTLIAKMVFLTIITLLPAIIKRRAPAAPPPHSTEEIFEMADKEGLHHLVIGGLGQTSAGALNGSSPPLSPVTQSLARFTPTPAAFDILSFGRTLGRQGGRVVRSFGEVAAKLGAGR